MLFFSKKSTIFVTLEGVTLEGDESGPIPLEGGFNHFERQRR